MLTTKNETPDTAAELQRELNTYQLDGDPLRMIDLLVTFITQTQNVNSLNRADLDEIYLNCRVLIAFARNRQQSAIAA